LTNPAKAQSLRTSTKRVFNANFRGGKID
jgi:hypothetical protein